MTTAGTSIWLGFVAVAIDESYMMCITYTTYVQKQYPTRLPTVV